MKDKSPVPHSHEYFVDLVKRLPKVPQNEWTDEELDEKHHIAFGNSLYMLFISQRDLENSPDSTRFRKENSYSMGISGLKKMEREYMEQWTRFLSANTDLVSNINEALVGRIAYIDLNAHYADLLIHEHNPTKAQDFLELGIEEVGVYAFRQLNPLLKEAVKKMREERIDPKEFFG